MSESTASYPFPVMGADRLDYISSCSYTTSDWSIESGQVNLLHQVEGESLISRLIKEDKAGFGCVVVIPSTMYRFISLCKDTGALSAKHTFEIEKKNRAIQIVKFLPLIFYKGENKEFVGSHSMGLDEIWNEQKFTLQKGAIIARDSWREIAPGLSHLLNVREGINLRKGAIDVDIADDNGGYFHVLLSTDLYKGFQKAESQGKEPTKWHRDSILTHALSVGMAKLAKGDSGDADWDLLENFQALKRTLEEEYGKAWDVSDFDPNKAACVYLPHCFDVIVKNEEK